MRALQLESAPSVVDFRTLHAPKVGNFTAVSQADRVRAGLERIHLRVTFITASVGITRELIRGDICFWDGGLMARAVLSSGPIVILYVSFLDYYVSASRRCSEVAGECLHGSPDRRNLASSTTEVPGSSPLRKLAADSLLRLRGSGRALWGDEHADGRMLRLRS